MQSSILVADKSCKSVGNESTTDLISGVVDYRCNSAEHQKVSGMFDAAMLNS